ncbi:hypothetical protein Francci3_4491 [Frankia casuarinae]|uniref:Uncharacterized protein n=1 Tax=Frankia casuarinae (strain DSM 45818 / CECT 9043 / HFP020203 / CcI3) TaxID=106370 RepID=Q2J4F5_FRACC|nr:hypothetical protein Francci3_4491 [Frankia casuarinae]
MAVTSVAGLTVGDGGVWSWLPEAVDRQVNRGKSGSFVFVTPMFDHGREPRRGNDGDKASSWRRRCPAPPTPSPSGSGHIVADRHGWRHGPGRRAAFSNATRRLRH